MGVEIARRVTSTCLTHAREAVGNGGVESRRMKIDDARGRAVPEQRMVLAAGARPATVTYLRGTRNIPDFCLDISGRMGANTSGRGFRPQNCLHRSNEWID